MNKEKLKENCCTAEGQIKRYIDCKGCDRKPKQETLKEAIDRIAKEDGYDIDGGKVADFVDGMVKGAKWQQERMYSEEEVEEIFKQAQLCAVKSDGVYFKYETFEQFKKK
jgi:hypothetical protein